LCFEKVLEAFARAVNKHGKKRIILALDQAVQYKRKQNQIPKGVELKYLPPKSPEHQPAEELWQFIDEAVAKG
jgi:hypothetical protein